jgi:hypothetical protein
MTPAEQNRYHDDHAWSDDGISQKPKQQELLGVIQRLTDYNAWRRNDDPILKQPEPKQLGLDIDYAIEFMQNSLDDGK